MIQRKSFTLLLVFLTVVLTFTPLAHAELNYTTQTVYCISDVFTTYETSGYGLYESNTASTVTAAVANTVLSAGFKVYLVTSTGTTELSTGYVAQLNRTSTGSGSQSATWSIPERSFTVGTAALKITLYLLTTGGTYTASATFVSEALLTSQINAATLTFTFYTALNATHGTVSWGSVSATGKVSGFDFEEPGVWDSGQYYFRSNNWVMFVIYPYVHLIGAGPFAALILFAFGVTAYVRFKSFAWLLLIMVILSVGGVLNLILGDLLWGLVAIIATFGLGVLYWKVFR